MSNREDWGEGGVRPADMRPYTLHDRIRAAVADERERSLRTSEHQDRRMASLCDHANRILDRHATWHSTDERRTPFCRKCGGVVPYPCPEVRDLAEAWGVTDA